LLYEIPQTKEGETIARLEIGELRALDGAAAVALIKALAGETDFERYLAAFSVNDRLRAAAKNARQLETELHASFGFRIVNPAAIIPLMCAPAVEPVTIRIHDELAGTVTWRTALDGAPATVVTSDPDLECDIRTFTPIATGFLKPEDAAALGLLKGDSGAVARMQAATAHWCAPFRSGLEEG
jgi:predicted acetyltransferase